MKRIFLIASLLFCIIGLTGCNKYNTYVEVSYDELQEKINNKDSFALVIGSNTCSACANYKKNMEEVIKDYQIEIFYLDCDKLSDEQDSKLYSKYVINATPTTIFIKDGEEESTYDRIIGASGYSDIVKNLKKHGIIGE